MTITYLKMINKRRLHRTLVLSMNLKGKMTRIEESAKTNGDTAKVSDFDPTELKRKNS